jgi:hypothetical protein
MPIPWHVILRVIIKQSMPRAGEMAAYLVKRMRQMYPRLWRRLPRSETKRCGVPRLRASVHLHHLMKYAALLMEYDGRSSHPQINWHRCDAWAPKVCCQDLILRGNLRGVVTHSWRHEPAFRPQCIFPAKHRESLFQSSRQKEALCSNMLLYYTTFRLSRSSLSLRRRLLSMVPAWPPKLSNGYISIMCSGSMYSYYNQSALQTYSTTYGRALSYQSVCSFP